ncbi:MAG: hypothetical protein WC199_05005 [Dysgonamonadaceae bacterium]
MKKTILFLSVLILFSSTILCGANNHQSADNKKTAQQENDNQGGQFLDANFKHGEVFFKDGTNSQQNLNYYLNSNQICYLNEKGEPLVLVDLSDIERVSYGDRTFIPIDKSNVTEVLKTFSDGSSLLLQRQAKVTRVKDTSGPYGTSTITATVSRLTTMHEWNIHQPLETENIYKPIIKEGFVLMKNQEKHKISKLNSLKKIFRPRWKEIKEYASQNNPDMKNPEDLIDLLEFCTKGL